MYCHKSLKKYFDDLAARLPAPGGGSAAALAAGLGAALISMVVNFTLGKPKYARFQAELAKTLADSERIRKRLLELTDLDIKAFKGKDIKKSLEVPLEVTRLCFEAMRLCPPLVKKGNINLISDVAVAAILLEAGFCSAMFNVKINLNFIKNKARVKKISRQLSERKNFLKRTRQSLEERCNEIIRG